MAFKKEKIEEIALYAIEHGLQKTAVDYGIKESTLEREIRRIGGNLKPLIEISEKYNKKDLQKIAKGGTNHDGFAVPQIDFSGDSIKYAHITDLHSGSNYFNFELYKQAIDTIVKEGCEFVLITGDLTDGLSNRPGHIYELTHIGYDSQKNYLKEILSYIPLPTYIIDGNHDRWYEKSNGALICKDVSDLLDHVTFLGQDEGDLLVRGIKIKLWHGEDGSSYAMSYRVQKIIESFTGGEKPHILHVGHTHKAFYMFNRHVHAVSGGAMCRQSRWMRSKKMENHYGFSICTMTVNANGVSRFGYTWYPFYL